VDNWNQKYIPRCDMLLLDCYKSETVNLLSVEIFILYFLKERFNYLSLQVFMLPRVVLYYKKLTIFCTFGNKTCKYLCTCYCLINLLYWVTDKGPLSSCFYHKWPMTVAFLNFYMEFFVSQRIIKHDIHRH
jgi:hypothetical protein